MNDTLIYQVQQLLYYNKINFDKKELAFQIQSHPSYPSLHAITGVLSHFDIDNLALSIPVDIGTLEQLPKSFLAQIETDEVKEFVIVNKNKSYCTILTSNKKKKKLINEEFLAIFTGIIVAVEKDELLENKKITKNNLGKILLILSSILFISLLFVSIVSTHFLIYFGLCLIGAFISFSIIQQEQGNQTALGNAFCSGVTDNKDCDAVISSKGALLFNHFKLSEASFVYFLSLIVSSLLLLIQGSTINSLYTISLIALPITIYSIYYQAVIVKKWCLLCLGIVGTLWAQIAIVLVSTDTLANFTFTIQSILLTSLGFLATIIFWNYISPKLKSIKELNQTKIDYFKFKRNFDLFNSLLEKSKTIDTSIPDTSEIVFGNRNTPLTITIITNPFCGHCRSVHTLIENILKRYAKEVQIIIRFNVNTNRLESDSDVVKITSKLLEVYETDHSICLNAMHDIYGGMNPKKWLNKWGDCNEKGLYLGVLTKENEWCKNNNINFTPQILVNGKSYPKEYDRVDLIYFIEELQENCSIDIADLQLTT